MPQNGEGAADVVNIKISKFGGLTKAKQAIDLCSDLGIAMTIEGESGGERWRQKSSFLNRLFFTAKYQSLLFFNVHIL